VKSTSIASLSQPVAGTYSFTAKSVISDVTTSAGTDVDSGATLEVTVVNATDSTPGQIAVSVQPQAGGMWIASGWDGVRTVLKPFAGGSIAGQ
jgi:hypothetical protein